MDFLQRIRQQLGQTWRQMSVRSRIVYGAAVVLGAAAIFGAAYWFGQTEYRVLYSQLSAEDAGAVTHHLQSQSIPYRLDANGTTVLVPEEHLHKARLSLAMEGLPAKSGKGFEILDNFSLGTPPFLQHVNYVRALQGELARTIMQIEPVTYARVHIVRPEPSPFLREQKPTTASVMLRLRPGATLNRRVAAGITSLVARAVEGLSPENVTLLDANGRLLSEPNGPEAGVVSSQLDYQRVLESYLSSKAEDLLGRVLGPGRAVVRVSADINFKRLREKKESYDPEGKVITSETITTLQSTGAGPDARGKTGAASNLPGRQPATAAGGLSSSTQQEITETKYAVSKTIKEYEDKIGSIERLTVAALVDLTPAGGAAATQSRQLSPLEVEELIKQAVGFKESRDQIKVSEAPLTLAAEQLPDIDFERIQQWQTILSLVRSGSIGAVAVVMLFLGWMLLRRRRGPTPEVPPAAAPAPAPPPASAASGRVLERVSRMAQENPQALAQVLSAWLQQPNGTANGR